MSSTLSVRACSVVILGSFAVPSFAQIKLPNLFPFPNAHGISQTYNKNGNGQIDFGNDAGALFRGPSANVFLVKVNYWLGL